MKRVEREREKESLTWMKMKRKHGETKTRISISLPRTKIQANSSNALCLGIFESIWQGSKYSRESLYVNIKDLKGKK